MPEIRHAEVIRYVQPLREGGSLPAIVEADDELLYVMKFRGAGQGKKALIAELIGGELARAIGLRVPEIVFLHLAEGIGKIEGDEEIQDLLQFSVGLNLGLHYLSGSITFDPLVSVADPLAASKLVLLDSLITNVDRTHRNSNLLNWNRELWLIDHGASLFFHHNWSQWEEQAGRRFAAIRDHVLLQRASLLPEAAEGIRAALSLPDIAAIVDLVPDEWLQDDFDDVSPGEKRQVYTRFIGSRFSRLDQLTKEASDAREAGI